MIRKFTTLIVITTLFFLTTACGDNDPVLNTTQNNENKMNDVENTTTEAESHYGFSSFELEADFEGIEDAAKVNYEKTSIKTEASYKDELQGIKLSGSEAMEELDTIFSSFKFDENTPDEEVLRSVINAFNIPKDAQVVELEIDFISGVEKEYHQ